MCCGDIWKIEVGSDRLIICSKETREQINPYEVVLKLFPEIELSRFRNLMWKIGVLPPIEITDSSYCYKITSSKFDVGVKRLSDALTEPMLFGAMRLIEKDEGTFCQYETISLA